MARITALSFVVPVRDLDFGDLGNVIVSKWQEFEDLFPSQHWVKQRLDELERSRNIIAHGNLLSDSEVERIEQYLDDWLRQVP